jgi:hypothetical protein
MIAERLLSALDRQREALDELQKHDADEIARTRRRIIDLESKLRGVKLQEALVASHGVALSRLDAELGRLTEVRTRLCHLFAHACANGTSGRRYLAGLSLLELSENTVAIIREQIKRVCLDEPTKELSEIAASLGDDVATPKTIEPTH